MGFRLVLKVDEGPLAGRKFSLDDNMTCIIGREKDCDIVISDEADGAVSRHHCCLKIKSPDILVRDMRSENGSFINETKLDPGTVPSGDIIPQDHDFKLKDGDELRVGQTVFKASIRATD